MTQTHDPDDPGPTDMNVMCAFLVGGFGAFCLAIVIAIVGSFDNPKPAEPGVTGRHLYNAYLRCEPYNATFEQILACTQAVYGDPKWPND